MVEDHCQLIEGKVLIEGGDAKGGKGVVPAPDVDHVVLRHVDRRPRQRAAGRYAVRPEQIARQAMCLFLACDALRNARVPLGEIGRCTRKGLSETAGSINRRHRAEEIDMALEGIGARERKGYVLRMVALPGTGDLKVACDRARDELDVLNRGNEAILAVRRAVDIVVARAFEIEAHAGPFAGDVQPLSFADDEGDLPLADAGVEPFRRKHEHGRRGLARRIEEFDTAEATEGPPLVAAGDMAQIERTLAVAARHPHHRERQEPAPAAEGDVVDIEQHAFIPSPTIRPRHP
jgi:hypothetical protein